MTIYAQRLERVQGELQQQGIDCLALVPGNNLLYMTGANFHLMERPTTLLIPAKGQPVMVLPALESLKLELPGLKAAQGFSYQDGTDPAEAYRNAFAVLPEIHRIAVEHLTMRVLELRLVQRFVPAAEVVDGGPVMSSLRVRKDAAEIAAMKQAISISERALTEVLAWLRPGMSEREIASRLMVRQIELGGAGELPFEPILLSGPNSALPHGTPGERKVQSGDVLLFDFGIRSGGYCSDITRTFFVGEASEEARGVYEAVRRANEAARLAARPGLPCQELDRIARKVIVDAGYGEYFTHRLGHGLGMDGHEHPYMVEGNEQLLEVGMTFTIEPGIYIPGLAGVRIEDDVVITETGAESLTTFPRELSVLGGAE